MSGLITPDEVPSWVPGDTIASSRGLGWRGVELRGYRYRGQRVHLPGLQDFMLVVYRKGATPLERRFEGGWTKAKCGPGRISLHTRGQASDWTWATGVEVDHLYLDHTLMTRLASESLARPVSEVLLRDTLDVEDATLWSLAMALRSESLQRGIGGSLYAEALAVQLGVHLLRHYASVALRPSAPGRRLSLAQQQRIAGYVEQNLGDQLDLVSLAGLLGMGRWNFSQRFRESFGCPPHAYVLERRLARAHALLRLGNQPLKEIAHTCGFSDQAHLSRAIKTRYQATPGALRRAGG